MAVTWRTDTTITETKAQITENLPTVFLADSAITVSGTWQDVTGDGITARYHSVIFTGLKPSGSYAYRLGSGKEASEWFTFSTAGTGETPFTFLWFGDTQEGGRSLYARVIRLAYHSAPEASLMVFSGDLVDGGSGSRLQDDEWGDWYEAAGFITAQLPLMATTGNHEFYDPQARQRRDLNRYWRAGFTLPANGPEGLEETAYSVDYQGVRFVFVNSDMMVRNEASARSQTEWVEGLLKDNPCKWTIFVFHHPLFSTAASRDNKVVRENLKPLFDKYGVDLVLTGHDHTYARGMAPQEGNTAKPGIAGTIYVVSVSGPKQYRQDADKWWSTGLTDTQLYQVITVDGNRLIYRAVDATGRVADQFVLTKTRDGRNMIGSPDKKKTK
jgi:3',5'-cyclic AMP phosphodiesterase CpdA